MAEPRPAPENLISGTTGGIFIYNIDKASIPNMTFIGIAEPGSASSSEVWKILLIDKTTSVTRVRYASSNSKFDKKWDDRVGYTYG